MHKQVQDVAGDMQGSEKRCFWRFCLAETKHGNRQEEMRAAADGALFTTYNTC